MLCGEGGGNILEPLQRYSRLHIELHDGLDKAEIIIINFQERK